MTDIATKDFFYALSTGKVTENGTIVIKGVQYDLAGGLYAPASDGALTALTHTAPTTPDYAIQALTTTSPYGFVSADEGNTVLKVIVNLALRVKALEDGIV